MTFIDYLKENNDVIHGKKNDKSVIIKAEQSLDIVFSKEYFNYLSEYSVVMFNGHELTGITNDKRLNVVDVTRNIRQIHPDMPINMYVIEELNIEGIVILQNNKGDIFQIDYSGNIKKIADSLYDYYNR